MANMEPHVREAVDERSEKNSGFDPNIVDIVGLIPTQQSTSGILSTSSPTTDSVSHSASGMTSYDNNAASTGEPINADQSEAHESQAETMEDDSSSIRKLEKKLRTSWEYINKARKLAAGTQRELTDKLCAHCNSNDMSIIILGSLARNEYTDGSDIDWFLLIDSQVDYRHQKCFSDIQKIINKVAKMSVGREGIFDVMVFSTSLVHNIGNELDTNNNLARRMALLIEAHVVGNKEAYERVLDNLLSRYLYEDHSLWNSFEDHVPKFLLRDFTRFWNTMHVSTQYKDWSRQGEGSVIRFIKLLMSRKLLYVSSCLVCFSFHTNFTVDQRKQLFNGRNNENLKKVIEHMKSMFQKPPLEIVADVLVRHSHLKEMAKTIIGSYDNFLKLLMNNRDELKGLAVNEANDNLTYKEACDFMENFHKGLMCLIYDESSGLKNLTENYINNVGLWNN
ncbi:hypothetical protein I4U23_027257 [Adineta vaga]|nr:hypothetical protein I4U23_027257 [Adineta vaga]